MLPLFLRRKKVLIFTVLVVGLLGVGVLFSQGDRVPSYETVIAGRQDLKEVVSATGRVQPADNVSLVFERSGRVGAVQVRVGDQVSRGAVLASLDASDLAAEVRREEARVETARAAFTQYQATRAAQNAKLTELLRGPRPEELAIAQVKVQNTDIALADAKNRLLAALRDAYTKADDALYNNADQLFSNPRTIQPQFNYYIANSQLETEIENGRYARGATLAAWKASLDVLSTEGDLVAAAGKAQEELVVLAAFFNMLGSAVNALTPNASLSQTTIDGYKTDIAAARAAVNTAISNVNTDTEKLRSAEASRTLAQNELQLTEAGATPEAIEAARAAVAEAEANIVAQRARIAEAEAGLESARAALGKTVLTAPIDGVVTRVDISPGELASSNVAIALISTGAFEIEVRVPEVDIAFIGVGNPAEVTLDAYGDQAVFSATVASIDPAETIVEGVATYTTTLSFDMRDDRVRSGMTANVSIVVGTRDHVVSVPGRAVMREGGQTAVRVIRNGEPVVVPVVTGLRGIDGNIEIVNGIVEGDEVVTFWLGE